jgi:hypothetical protein
MKMRWARHITSKKALRNAHKNLARKPQGKRLVGSCTHRWEDNIKMGLKKMGCKHVDRIKSLRIVSSSGLHKWWGIS